MLKNINCNLCGQNNFRTLQADKSFEVVKCKNCGLIFITPLPEGDKLFNHYDKEYYAPWLKEQFISRKRMWKRRLKEVQSFKKTGKLLDVGCGTGLFLNEAKRNGWDVYGTEVSKYALDHAKDAFGIEIFGGELKENNFPDNFFDVITFWHVLEHTKDPLGNLTEARRILKSNGILIVAVPNIRNYIYKIAYMLIKLKRAKLFSLSDREIHLYHFSVSSLKKMVEKAGFLPIRFDVDTGRIMIGERILDVFAWVLYKTLKINIGMAIEVYAKKSGLL